MLGGIFEVSYKNIPPDFSFTSKPGVWKCDSLDFEVFQWAHTMMFAIEEINKDQSLLPNITLGYWIYDNCIHLQVALRAAIALIGGLDDNVMEYNCKGLPPVVAVVGDPRSSYSIAIERILGLFRMPLVSYYATCSCLSNKIDYPSFFRTVPSDAFQVQAMVQIIKHFGWTWVGVIGTDDEYGQSAVKSFHEEMSSFGCIAFTETFPKAQERERYLQIVNTIKKSTAKVIVVFSPRADLLVLSAEIIRQNVTGRQWIASEAWSTSNILATNENFPSFGGTIGIAIRRGEIPELENFLLQIQPSFDPNNNLLPRFWETMFGCKFQDISKQNDSALPVPKVCTGYEDINSSRTAYTDVSESRATYNVYKAVYALAHALHQLMLCENGKGPFENNTCADIKSLQPWQLMHYLKKVNFTNRLGERVVFDENGDALAIYDIVNWQRAGDGSVTIKTIGVYDKAASKGQEVFLSEKDIFWNFDSGKVPESVCSKSCQPGTRKATRKGQPVCCFDCLPCADGEISKETDSIECSQCSSDFWSNPSRTQCILKEIEFLSYEDAMGITLTTTAIFGSCLSVSVLIVFIYYRNTPVVKANNSELSFLLLLSLTLCFLCSLCFIGEPSNATCMLRHVVFGISFVLSISCILVKTIVVIMAFKATLPGNNMMKWFGATQQRGTIFMFTFIQSLICVVWLTSAPPFSSKNIKHQNSKIIFECDVGSFIGFSCLLGYIGLLAGISFLLAFLARNLPDTFNEAKFITFSMLIFCAVWITFIPAYISSPGKYTVAVEIFAILASSFGLLGAIFAPKCYIILLKPEKNTKKALMGR
ncbi:extracellular calcium-sensing receptor-like [Polypterus senegalus]|uniref:extracellular calcium-sensing receptor-like n=1 Tax=Polypterus senegalus TaxID=55291 RepID=UPI00196611DE|nr:extracellular calcium-sensing receptor-like [Polypterus senegalus]